MTYRAFLLVAVTLLLVFPWCLVPFVGQPSAYAQEFTKGGNNGTATCSEYCSNQWGAWGRYGVCVKGHIDTGPKAGRDISCDERPGVGNFTQCSCQPSPSAFEKGGNNGTVSCNDYCKNNGFDWGQYGDCVGAVIHAGPRASAAAECSERPGAPILCYCKVATPVTPVPPPADQSCGIPRRPDLGCAGAGIYRITDPGCHVNCSSGYKAECKEFTCIGNTWTQSTCGCVLRN